MLTAQEAPPQGRGMNYVCETLNRDTGELETRSLGRWMTITEFAHEMNTGPRHTRQILVRMGVLYTAHGERGKTWTQIQPWIEERGWGKRQFPKNGRKIPFDVINEEAQSWIKARWETTYAEVFNLSQYATQAQEALQGFLSRRIDPDDLEASMQAIWLLDHFPDLSHSEVGRIIGVSQQMVSKAYRIYNQRAMKRFDALNPNPEILPRVLGQIPFGPPLK